MSLLIAAGTAVFGFALWRLWQSDDTIEPVARALEDVELTWRCEGGHTFSSSGQMEPRPCWKCGQIAYPITQFACPTHGSFDVAVRFGVGADGIPVPQQLRLPGGPWTLASDGLRCPRCGQELKRVPDSPVARLNEELSRKDARSFGSP